MKEPEINVGIVNALEIAFTLNAKFLAKGETVSGKQRVSFDEGGISWNGTKEEFPGTETCTGS